MTTKDFCPHLAAFLACSTMACVFPAEAGALQQPIFKLSKNNFSYSSKTKTPAVRVGSRMAGVQLTVIRQNQIKRDDCFLRQVLSIFIKITC
jgi:hypothetical protein